MKIVSTLSTVAVLAATSAQAASLIAGWNMSNYQADNFPNTVEGSITSIDSTYNDFAGDGLANSNGSIAYQGNAIGSVVAITTNLTTGASIQTRVLGPGFNTPGSGFIGQTNFSMLVRPGATGGNLLFSTNTGAEPIDFTAPASGVQFAATINLFGSDDAVLDWSYSLDGGNTFLGLQTTTIGEDFNAGGGLYNLDLSPLGVHQGDLQLMAEVTSVTLGSELFLDNIQITGEVVPEPSTYAAIAGALALGLAAIRRRRA